MHIVLISPHYPPNFIHFAERLREVGATVSVLTDVPAEALPDRLRRAQSDHYYVPDMQDEDAMIRALGWFTHRHGRIHRIDSHNEHWLEVEARLRDAFDIPGQRPADTARNRSKWSMKTLCREHGVPCIEGVRVDGPASVRAFVREVGYPIILKPEIGVGAARTYRVDDEATLEDVLKERLDGYLAERFATGALVSFDGLADGNAEVLFCATHRFNAGIMDIVHEQRHMEYHSLRRLEPELEELGRRTVRAFAIRERFFHIEFFKEAEDQFRLLEVNVRPPGLFSIDMMNYACDVDLYAAWARLVTGADPGLAGYERAYHVTYVGRRSHLSYSTSHEQVIRDLGDRVVLHDEVPQAFRPAMGDYCYLVREETEVGILRAIQLIGAPHA